MTLPIAMEKNIPTVVLEFDYTVSIRTILRQLMLAMDIAFSSRVKRWPNVRAKAPSFGRGKTDARNVQAAQVCHRLTSKRA
jgi:hypothetical protein